MQEPRGKTILNPELRKSRTVRETFAEMKSERGSEKQLRAWGRPAKWHTEKDKNWKVVLDSATPESFGVGTMAPLTPRRSRWKKYGGCQLELIRRCLARSRNDSSRPECDLCVFCLLSRPSGSPPTPAPLRGLGWQRMRRLPFVKKKKKSTPASSPQTQTRTRTVMRKKKTKHNKNAYA